MATVTRPLLSAQRVSKRFGAQALFEGLSLTVHEGDRIGLIGRNGCGKTTLLKLLGGDMRPDAGEIVEATGIRVARLRQEAELDPALSVGQTLAEAEAPRRALADAYAAALDRLADSPDGTPDHDKLHAECDRLHHAVEIAGAWNPAEERNRMATALRLPDEDRILGSLSGGELRRVDLAATLLSHPDVLLLDEPTNHIDTASIEWIERYLEGYAGSCVLITHDRYFLDRITNRIVELEFGQLYSFPGNYSRFLEQKALVEESRLRTEANRLAMIRRELDWYRRGPQARATKQKARMERIEAAMDDSGPPKHREFAFDIPQTRPLGKTIVEARDTTLRLGDDALFRGFSCILQKEMRIGIAGPNGAGKTSLIRMLLGELRPQKGHVVVGETVDFLYLDQRHDDVDPDTTVIQYLTDGQKHWEVGKRRIYIPGYLESFLFDGSVSEMPMGRLSGGERNRVALVRRFLRGGNVLVLDEPTNDLDLYSLRVLEEAVVAFPGPALIVSHDRYFLNRLCTHMWVFDDTKIHSIVGDYDDYLLFRERTAAEASAAKASKPANNGTSKSRKNDTNSQKLSYKERQELADMEGAIETAEAILAELDAVITAPDFYKGDADTVQARLAEWESQKAHVEGLYARWAELEARAG